MTAIATRDLEVTASSAPGGETGHLRRRGRQREPQLRRQPPSCAT